MFFQLLYQYILHIYTTFKIYTENALCKQNINQMLKKVLCKVELYGDV